VRATLKDVAVLAGVSVKTVSNVINGYPHLRPATRERVERAIAELHYRPNLTARSLRRGRTGLIGLALPQINNPYFSELAQSVVQEAERHHLTVLIDCTDGVAEREQRVIEGFHEHAIDGLILLPHALEPHDLSQRRDETPMVLLGERLAEHADCVSIDSQAAGRAATEHLIALGRRRIALIGGARPDGVTNRLRTAGYEEALNAAGLDVDPALQVTPVASTAAGGEGAVRRLLASPTEFDALVCHNDLLAIGAMRVLREHDIRVPQDVAVVGMDDIELSRYATPPLSSIAPDKALIAHSAVAMLVERLGNDSAGPPRQVTTGFSLVVRESSAGSRPPA
jgi:DNA-binding LacI/PurR family transcriptional regulator